MTALMYLIPAALLLGGVGLAAFLWTLKSGQYSDLDGAAYRILFEDENDFGADEKSGTPVIPQLDQSSQPGITESPTSQRDNRV